MKKKELLQLLEAFHDEIDVTIYNSGIHEVLDIAIVVPAASSETGDISSLENTEFYPDRQPVVMLVAYGDYIETGKPFRWNDLIGLQEEVDCE